MTPSDRAVAALIQRDGRISKGVGFMAAMREAVKESVRRDMDFDPSEVWREHVKGRGRIQPDAFLIDRETKAATAYEVEDSNPMRFEKIGRLAEFANLLYEFYWDLEVVVLDTDLNERYRFNAMLAYLYEAPEGADPRANIREWMRQCVSRAAGRDPQSIIVDGINERVAVDDAVSRIAAWL